MSLWLSPVASSHGCLPPQPRRPRRHPHRRHHRIGPRNPPSRDVEGRAVCGGGADDGQSDHLRADRPLPRHLRGDVPLVVVHDEDHRVASVADLGQEGVGGGKALRRVCRAFAPPRSPGGWRRAPRFPSCRLRPAWGLSAATPMRGSPTPQSTSVSCARMSLSNTASNVTASGTSRRAMWFVT